MLAAGAGKPARHLAVIGDDVFLCLKDWTQKFNSCKQPGFAGRVVCHVASMGIVERSLCKDKSSEGEPSRLIVFTSGEKVHWGQVNWGQSNINFLSKGVKGKGG